MSVSGTQRKKCNAKGQINDADGRICSRNMTLRAIKYDRVLVHQNNLNEVMIIYGSDPNLKYYSFFETLYS